MFNFKVNKLTSRVYQIIDTSYTFMYLVVGKERAALIDTGIGNKDDI